MNNKHHKSINIRYATLVKLTFILAISNNSYATNLANIQFENFWVSKAPKVARSTAAYGTIKNIGKEIDTLISIRSDVALIVMLYETQMSADMVKMEHVSHHKIKPGSALILKPMSFHLMLMNLDSKFNTSNKAKLWFKFKESGELEVDVPILSAEEGKEYQQFHIQ